MIVDYANVFASLERALAIYGAGKDGQNPVKDKQKLVADLRKAIAAATAFCAQRSVCLEEIESLPAGSMKQLQTVGEAVNALIAPESWRRDFFGHERVVGTLYRAVKPDPTALEFFTRVSCISAIGGAIRSKLNPSPADISEVMGGIRGLLDESISGIRAAEPDGTTIDLSKIDFRALAAVIFDILTRPAPELSTAERAEVKKVARDLLARLRLLLVLNWRQKSSARSQLKLAIEDVLDSGLPRAYDKPLFEKKCTALFEHVYESYPERDEGVYSPA